MAQNRDKDETELKVPASLPLCSPPPITELSGGDDLAPCPSRLSDGSDLKRSGSVGLGSNSVSSSGGSDPIPDSAAEEKPRLRRREVNRCFGCRRKVGLTGFRCRCGEMFCSQHRYSDRHDCSFDYKAAGREAIARENPVVRPAKILKV